jgi:hypothetical protein
MDIKMKKHMQQQQSDMVKPQKVGGPKKGMEVKKPTMNMVKKAVKKAKGY